MCLNLTACQTKVEQHSQDEKDATSLIIIGILLCYGHAIPGAILLFTTHVTSLGIQYYLLLT